MGGNHHRTPSGLTAREHAGRTRVSVSLIHSGVVSKKVRADSYIPHSFAESSHFDPTLANSGAAECAAARNANGFLNSMVKAVAVRRGS